MLNRRRRTASSVEVLPPPSSSTWKPPIACIGACSTSFPSSCSLRGWKCAERNATGYEGAAFPANMANDIGKAMARLKHRDIRTRRRAVRTLFEHDDPSVLEAFKPLLDDNDTWFVSKALDAYRMWGFSREAKPFKHSSPIATWTFAEPVPTSYPSG